MASARGGTVAPALLPVQGHSQEWLWHLRSPGLLCYAVSNMDAKNQLYFGDNLKILRDYVPDASVDLIYLDPPFNSAATYNVFFTEKSGEEPAAPIMALERIRQPTDNAACNRRLYATKS